MATRRSLIALAVGCALLSACSHGAGNPSASSTTVPANTPKADETLRKVASALSALDAAQAPLSGPVGYANSDLATVTKGLGGLKPTVKPGTIVYHAAQKTAEGELSYSWPTFPKAWEYKTNAKLVLVGDTWQWQYDPSAVQANLTGETKLVATRDYADRGAVFGNGGRGLVELHDVVNVGLDKSQVPDAAEQEASARSLARVVKIDENAYVSAVKNAGAQAFVLATVLRGTAAPSELGGIKGARGLPDKAMLGPTKSFGQPVLGTLGSPTQDRVDKSQGAVDRQSLVGTDGIQAWHDADLRGKDGIRVDLVYRDGATAATASPAPGQVVPSLLYKLDPVPGNTLKLTMDYDWQNKAEAALADASSPSALALVQPSTGRVLALAVSPSAQNAPLANWSKNAPGSTFKIVSTLALLRHGLTPDSVVDCPASTTVNGQEFHNSPTYPASQLGQIKLRDALAQSCNTAFVNATRGLPKDALKQAAASLGLGEDYDPAYQSYFGDVPVATSDAEFAMDSFGQGQVLVSPMALAGVVASVAAGHTVIPWLVEGAQPQPKAGIAPLTADEAKQLQSAMGSVSEYGSTSSVKDILVGGKTGTAEYGSAGDLKAHVWLVGYTAHDVAVVAFAQDGNYGTDLAPVLRKVFA